MKTKETTSVNALTVNQTLRLPYNYPGVRQKIQKEFELLVDMNCFQNISEEESKGFEVVNVILIPTLKNNTDIKVRVELRGDTIKEFVEDMSANLPTFLL